MAAAGVRKERIDRGIKARAESIYSVSSWREMTYLIVPRALLAGILLVLPLLVPLYWQKVLCSMGVYALLAISFDFLANYVGLVCLGGAFFTGVGGYLAGILNLKLGLPLYATIPIASVAGGVICTILLLPCLPLRGVYFAVITSIYPIAATKVITALNVCGGTEGLNGVDYFPGGWYEIYLVVGAVLVALFSLRRLVKQDYGIVLQAIRDNEQAVRASNINVNRFKIQAVFMAATVGCFAGAYLSHLYGWCGLSLFALDLSILPITATVMGGMGTLAGPVVGALILVPLSEALRFLGTWRIVCYCLMLLGFIVFKPEGIMNYLSRKYNQLERVVRV